MVRAVFQKVYQRLFGYIDRNLKYIDLPTKIDKQKRSRLFKNASSSFMTHIQ